MSVYLRVMLKMAFVPTLNNYYLRVVLNRFVGQKSVLHKVVLGVTLDLQSF